MHYSASLTDLVSLADSVHVTYSVVIIAESVRHLLSLTNSANATDSVVLQRKRLLRATDSVNATDSVVAATESVREVALTDSVAFILTDSSDLTDSVAYAIDATESVACSRFGCTAADSVV